MAVKPAKPAPNIRATLHYSVSEGKTVGGEVQTTSTASNAPLPGAGTTQILVGVDAIPFTVAPGQSLTLSFPNLAARTAGANPVAPSSGVPVPLPVLDIDQLIFTAYAQNANAFVQIQTQAVDTKDVVFPGPFLATGTFLSFQVVITAPASGPTVSGLIVGHLVLASSS